MGVKTLICEVYLDDKNIAFQKSISTWVLYGMTDGYLV